MSEYYSKLDANIPATPFVRLSALSYVTDVIPPKYFESFTCERVADKIGTFKLNLVVPVDTFKQSSDSDLIKLTTSLAQLDNQFGEDGTSLEIPCKLEYGWRGHEIVNNCYNQALITEFNFNYSGGVNGASYTISIGGFVNKQKETAYETNKSVKISDYIEASADKSQDNLVSAVDTLIDVNELGNTVSASDALQTLQSGAIDFTIVEAGKRLSDKIELLAKYVFGQYYNVIVDHVDRIYEEDTQIQTILTSSSYLESIGGNKLNFSSLYTYLQALVSCCLDDTYSEYASLDIDKDNVITKKEAQQSLSTYSNKAQSELIDAANNANTDTKKSGENIKSYQEVMSAAETFIDSGKESVSYNSPYQLVFIDKPNKNEKGNIYIGPSNTSDSKQYNFVISNNVKDSTVISFTVGRDYINVISAMMKYVKNEGEAYTINPDLGIYEVQAPNTSDSDVNAVDYADSVANLVLQDISQYTTNANLTVLSDMTSRSINVLDTVTIKCTVNNGESIFTGSYLVRSVQDSINSNGDFTTSFGLTFAKSDAYNSVFKTIHKQITNARSKKVSLSSSSDE